MENSINKINEQNELVKKINQLTQQISISKYSINYNTQNVIRIMQLLSFLSEFDESIAENMYSILADKLAEIATYCKSFTGEILYNLNMENREYCNTLRIEINEMLDIRGEDFVFYIIEDKWNTKYVQNF